MNMEFKRKLPTPQTVKDMYPVTEELARQKQENDRQIKAVITGEDQRLMLLIGPCSADREDAVLEYAARLRTLQERVKDTILIVPRIYSNKPRTTGDGYKGMLHQPDPNGQPDMLKGLIAIRKMHMKVLEQTGFSSADELLYPENYYYLSDILSYAAIGARSVEDQQHRLIASGLDVPVGMKNPTSGDLTVMMNSIQAAQHAHHEHDSAAGERPQKRLHQPALVRDEAKRRDSQHDDELIWYDHIFQICKPDDQQSPACKKSRRRELHVKKRQPDQKAAESRRIDPSPRKALDPLDMRICKLRRRLCIIIGKPG